MATRFDPKEYSRQRIVTLCAKYLPKDLIKINVGRARSNKLRIL
jgi:hypothetical protein